MKKVTFAILGMGNRGTAYAARQLEFPEKMEVVAMADTRRVRLDSANKHLGLPEERLFDSADSILAQPKLADIMVIATQDAQHKDHAIRAMELGYDLLLEKPISNKLEDIREIVAVAEKLGRRVIICHVLRYTHFYKNVKRLLDQGVVGRIMSVQMDEHVGVHHMAHSFVRGNWHKESDSSPMILAKCCHDMDLILWLTGKRWEKVNSFGSLEYFKAENCPEGAAERCADCGQDCIFHAQRYYLSRLPGWPANILHPEPNEENIRKALDETDYGRCVYKMDNDVVDHQSLNILLEDGITATFTMNAFSRIGTRTLRISGTEGEIWGDLHAKELSWRRYDGEIQKIGLGDTGTKGHSGGDSGIILDLLRLYQGEDFDTSSITTIARSAESHYLAFAAEESRVRGGVTISVEEFKRSHDC